MKAQFVYEALDRYISINENYSSDSFILQITEDIINLFKYNKNTKTLVGVGEFPWYKSVSSASMNLEIPRIGDILDLSKYKKWPEFQKFLSPGPAIVFFEDLEGPHAGFVIGKWQEEWNTLEDDELWKRYPMGIACIELSRKIWLGQENILAHNAIAHEIRHLFDNWRSGSNIFKDPKRFAKMDKEANRRIEKAEMNLERARKESNYSYPSLDKESIALYREKMKKKYTYFNRTSERSAFWTGILKELEFWKDGDHKKLRDLKSIMADFKELLANWDIKYGMDKGELEKWDKKLYKHYEELKNSIE